jgi:hypothetical protein
MLELLVVDFSETGVCEELCGASDVVIFLVVCSVVIGASLKLMHLSKVTNKLIACTLPRARMELSFSDFSR